MTKLAISGDLEDPLDDTVMAPAETLSSALQETSRGTHLDWRGLPVITEVAQTVNTSRYYIETCDDAVVDHPVLSETSPSLGSHPAHSCTVKST